MQDDTMNKSACFPRRSTAYWLLVRSETEGGREDGDAGAGWAKARTVMVEGSKEALALFSFEEEAGMFVWCGTAEDGWHPRKTTPEELLQMLAGPHANAAFVALDPLPELIFTGMASLVSLTREHVVDLLIERMPIDEALPRGS